MVPIPETLDYIRRRLLNEPKFKNWTTIPIDNFLTLLELCITCTYFKYQNNHFLQESGTAMGSPISPVFAELYRQFLESSLIISNPHIHYWTRYVDDVFSIIRARKLNHILETINGFHPAIKFTVEEEKDVGLPFLDVLVYNRSDGSFGHKIYRN